MIPEPDMRNPRLARSRFSVRKDAFCGAAPARAGPALRGAWAASSGKAVCNTGRRKDFAGRISDTPLTDGPFPGLDHARQTIILRHPNDRADRPLRSRRNPASFDRDHKSPPDEHRASRTRVGSVIKACVRGILTLDANGTRTIEFMDRVGEPGPCQAKRMTCCCRSQAVSMI
jgi:hypothetical protein